MLAAILGGVFAIGAILVDRYSAAPFPLAIAFIIAAGAAVTELGPNFWRLLPDAKKEEANLADGDVDPGGLSGSSTLGVTWGP